MTVQEGGFSYENLFLHRSGKWYFRQYIPVDLRKHFGGRSDVAFSLKTSEKIRPIYW